MDEVSEIMRMREKQGKREKGFNRRFKYLT
jgi:hypothetical protein